MRPIFTLVPMGPKNQSYPSSCLVLLEWRDSEEGPLFLRKGLAFWPVMQKGDEIPDAKMTPIQSSNNHPPGAYGKNYSSFQWCFPLGPQTSHCEDREFTFLGEKLNIHGSKSHNRKCDNYIFGAIPQVATGIKLWALSSCKFYSHCSPHIWIISFN